MAQNMLTHNGFITDNEQAEMPAILQEIIDSKVWYSPEERITLRSIYKLDRNFTEAEAYTVRQIHGRICVMGGRGK